MVPDFLWEVSHRIWGIKPECFFNNSWPVDLFISFGEQVLLNCGIIVFSPQSQTVTQAESGRKKTGDKRRSQRNKTVSSHQNYN